MLLSIPFLFTPGTPALSAQVDANFTACEDAVNSIDWRNVGSGGILPSQIIPTTALQAVFGGNFDYSFPGNVIVGNSVTNGVVSLSSLNLKGSAAGSAFGVQITNTNSTGNVASFNSNISSVVTITSAGSIIAAGAVNANAFSCATDITATGTVHGSIFYGSGAGLTNIPNTALVTPPVASVTASGNLASSGGLTPNITLSTSPTFLGLTVSGSLGVTTLTAGTINVSTIVPSGSFNGVYLTNSGLGAPIGNVHGSAIGWDAIGGQGEMDFATCSNPGTTAFAFWRYNGSTYAQIATISTSGTYTASDVTLKENITPIKYGLATILALEPSSFTWKEHKIPGVGLIAQLVQKLVPEIVEEMHAIDGENMLGLNYNGIIPILIKAMQEQQAMIADLQHKIGLA